jgi:DNA-binding PucR family transcriptional regulator
LVNNPFQASFSSLDEFIDIASEVFQSPMTVEDANHRLLSYSKHDKLSDPARISTIIERRVPEKVINHLWKEGIIPTLLSSKEPVRIPPIDEIGFLGDRIAISIWRKEEVIGFIWVLEVKKKFDVEDFQLLKKAAETAKNIILQKHLQKNRKESRHQEFLWQLLTSHYHSNDDIVNKFHSLQLNPPPCFSVITIDFGKEITNENGKVISYLLQTIQQVKILLMTIDNSQLILLLSLDKNEPFFHTLENFCQTFIARMEERHGIDSLVQGIGGVYEDYLKIEKSYQESLMVLKIKEKFPKEVSNLHSYQSLGIYKYLDVIQEKAKRDQYENYSLKKLNEYDRKYNYDLVETLEVFLKKDGNVHEAARELNVHTNTLNYRLKRIAEIGEVDLKNVNQKMTLYLDLMIERLL